MAIAAVRIEHLLLRASSHYFPVRPGLPTHMRQARAGRCKQPASAALF
jgi:hypothetical protein